MRTALGCILSVLLLAVAVAVAIWALEPDWQRFQRQAGPVEPAGPAVVEDQLDRVAEGDTVRLTDAEATALLHGPLSAWVPADWSSPAITMREDTLQLYGSVRKELLPAPGELESVRALLPDTVRLELSGTVGRLEPGTARFSVHGIRVSRVPIPTRFHGDILRGFRPPDMRLGPTDLVAPLPPPVREARVAEGRLILYP